MPRDIKITREIGSNAPDLICELASSSTIAAVNEFIANSHDADAERVDIKYIPEEDRLIISDDGEGMNLDGSLQGFFRLGDSKKLQNPITKKGRRTIGKFGIATILLKYLAHGYRLETVRGNQGVVVEESFGGSLSADSPIPYRVFPPNGRSSGTTIEMRGLKFKEADLDLPEFRRRVSWEMPILPDFKVFINEEEVGPKAIDTALEYRFEKDGESMGHVSGVFYFTARPTEDAGVHIYVNGRRVGDPTYFQLQRIKAFLATRLVGLIEADGIEDAILFDRGRFKEDHPGFRELEDTLRKVIFKVKYDIEKTERKKENRKAGNKIDRILKSEEGIAASVLKKQVSIRPKAKGLKSSDGSVQLDQESLLFSPDNLNTEAYRANVRHAIAESVAMQSLPEDMRGAARKFLKEKRLLLERLTEEAIPSSGESDSAPDIKFNDYRVYSAAEISSGTGWKLGDVRRMMASGFLLANDDRARGEDITRCLERVNGYTSLYLIAHETTDANIDVPHAYDIRRGQFDEYADGMPFVVNVGNGESLFYIKDEFVEDVKEAIKAGLLDRKIKGDNPLQKIAEKHLTAPELSKYLGIGVDKVAGVIDYATQRGHDLGVTGKGTPKFNYLVVGRAAREMGAIS